MIQDIVTYECPDCGSAELVKNGHDYKGSQKYPCILFRLTYPIHVDKALDYSIVTAIPLNLQVSRFRLYEEIGKLDLNQRLAPNIIQHPRGRRKNAIRDNYVEEFVSDVSDPERSAISLCKLKLNRIL